MASLPLILAVWHSVLGSIDKKLSSSLAYFCRSVGEGGRGWGRGLSESVKKGKFVTKSLFLDNVEKSSKNLWKMTTRSKRSGDCIFTKFYKKYLQNLKYNVKASCIFHLVLIGVLSILILSVKNRGSGWEEGLPNGQNLLSVSTVPYSTKPKALKK